MRLNRRFGRRSESEAVLSSFLLNLKAESAVLWSKAESAVLSSFLLDLKAKLAVLSSFLLDFEGEAAVWSTIGVQIGGFIVFFAGFCWAPFFA